MAIGIDLGGTSVRAALGDSKGHILKKLAEKSEKTKGPEGISEQIIRMIHQIQTEKIGGGKIQGITIGSTGPLNLKKGGLMKPTNFPYDFVPLVEPLEGEFDLPTCLLNDCSAAATGEKFFGMGIGHENLVYITLSTGIGGGIYVDNHLLFGKDGNAHEVGHFTIDFEGHLVCPCGKIGHWEAYCSGRGIPDYAELLLREEKPKELRNSSLLNDAEGDLGKITAKALYNSAKAGDPISVGIVEKIGLLNAVGFACVVDAYDPTLITVGGSIALNNASLVIKPITQHVDEHTRNRVPQIAVTPLGDDAVLYGALASVFHPGE
jgi:glucokinase